MKVKKILYTIFLILWMVIIFLFSNQNATTSQSTSDIVTNTVIKTVENITSHKPKQDTVSYFVRKTAHFSVYLVLGILSYLTFTSYGISKSVYYAILFCAFYACSDEVHQMFLEGRSCQIFDVCIDTCGSIGGVFLSKFCIKRC